ncbi:MAG: 50S ribosomal protein P1 [Candidatus Diapherotrites archaeon]|uniref:Large ribosomal subunit protein P1 n=1 Tax=Candidatus Iainarchaeum sp. TaxID=3101447 RepID=A0A8T3YL37_9ARCH|nr:50S ribosomal protein P1 [Candidatus Diapherotrites archaeon]
MEYVYAAMLLHSAKKEISEAHVKKVLEAAGVNADDSRIKALVASLKDIKIDEAIQKAAVAAPAAAPAAPAHAGAAEAKKEHKEEDNKKSEEEAAAGLGSLFG